jgi:TRAP-type uncharacterized transport system substrate-binding protein
MSIRGAVRVGLFIALIAAAWFGVQVQRSLAQTRPSDSPSESAKVPPQKESAPRKEAGISQNRYTTGLVTGAPQSTEFAIAQEIATTLATGQETGPRGEMALRVMPMVGNGGDRNILDILTLAGADMAIAPVVLVDRLREAKTFGDISGKLAYIAPLFTEEFHLLARPEIKTLTDLTGKTVNLGEEGGASAILGREVFNRLDVKIKEVNLGLDAALDGMRTGQVFATLLVSGKPVNLLARYAQPDSIHFLHFLPVPASPALEHDYLPTTLSHDDYPDIIAAGERVDTIAVQTALFAYNWPIRSERFRLLESFVQTFFSRFPEFLDDSHHPQWREVNLAARLPGWQRFGPAERWLQRSSAGAAGISGAMDQFLKQNPNLPNREELLKDFQWLLKSKQGK